MKEITKYQAYNGREFSDPDKCAVYENNCRCADFIISQLHPNPDGSDFFNGGGYLQHDPAKVAMVRSELLALAAKETDHKWITKSINDSTVDPSWAGGIISECCTENLYRAWIRISCIDAASREWGQPYYRQHPEEAQQVCLNQSALA